MYKSFNFILKRHEHKINYLNKTLFFVLFQIKKKIIPNSGYLLYKSQLDTTKIADR